MRKTWSSVLALAAATAALAACGGDDGAREDNLGANWTLTIVSPEHGAELGKGPVTVEVAVTGRGSANGDAQDFEIGYFVDDVLVAQSSDLQTVVELEAGTHAIRVEGLLGDGSPDRRVQPDEIQLLIDANLVEPPRQPNDFQNVDVNVFNEQFRPDIEVLAPNLPEVNGPTTGELAP